ncbi:unnamed protein product [Protopolystoma xenopodis]|uniref:Uncharacterized protein n=1 Tax=Protopolystoma xenopodis TaxID=117903 RepID=A0A3S5CIC7_9PLAT|nr:unnamed protein product [Protopolystoma xenopodis]
MMTLMLYRSPFSELYRIGQAAEGGRSNHGELATEDKAYFPFDFWPGFVLFKFASLLKMSFSVKLNGEFYLISSPHQRPEIDSKPGRASCPRPLYFPFDILMTGKNGKFPSTLTSLLWLCFSAKSGNVEIRPAAIFPISGLLGLTAGCILSILSHCALETQKLVFIGGGLYVLSGETKGTRERFGVGEPRCSATIEMPRLKGCV